MMILKLSHNQLGYIWAAILYAKPCNVTAISLAKSHPSIQLAGGIQVDCYTGGHSI